MGRGKNLFKLFKWQVAVSVQEATLPIQTGFWQKSFLQGVRSEVAPFLGLLLPAGRRPLGDPSAAPACRERPLYSVAGWRDGPTPGWHRCPAPGVKHGEEGGRVEWGQLDLLLCSSGPFAFHPKGFFSKKKGLESPRYWTSRRCRRR